MATEPGRGFWSTLPGVVTAIAAFITSVTALFVALKPAPTPSNSASGAATAATQPEPAIVLPDIPDLTPEQIKQLGEKQDAERQRIQAEQDEFIRQQNKAEKSP